MHERRNEEEEKEEGFLCRSLDPGFDFIEIVGNPLPHPATIFAGLAGLVYGIVVKSIKNDKDLVRHITNSISGMAGYIVLVFFAAQFVYFFNYSNLGIIFAIKGTDGLQQIGLTGPVLIVGFIMLSASLICLWARLRQNGPSWHLFLSRY